MSVYVDLCDGGGEAAGWGVEVDEDPPKISSNHCSLLLAAAGGAWLLELVGEVTRSSSPSRDGPVEPTALFSATEDVQY